MQEDDLQRDALSYHEGASGERPGKIAVRVTRPVSTARHLTLAYSPGVAAPVRAIAANPAAAYRYTAKGNLVAVISNGSAILGLGNLGALPSKPVMEGKALLFKALADVDAIDIEIDAETVDDIVDTVARIADTFGGINLEDIRAPECFEIEQQLIDRCSVPVFHDDQHGTAIVVAAGLLNALELQQKRLQDVRTVILGAGASAIACRDMLVAFGLEPENAIMLDRRGVIHTAREDELSGYKQRVAVNTMARTLEAACMNADVLIGLAGPGLVSEEAVLAMAERPAIFVCSNPDPEIAPELVAELRGDVITATGRSDYPNQVNNVLGFPYIFRGALDVRARRIDMPMKRAAVEALRALAHEPVPPELPAAYPGETLEFGSGYILPKPTDPRLFERVSSAVAAAALQSGAASAEMMAEFGSASE